MSVCTLSPYAFAQFFTDAGVPLSGGWLYTYTAGTSTPATTYTDAAGLVPNTNPIVLDAAGRCVIFLPAASFKFVLENSAHVQIDEQDNVQATSVTPGASAESTTTLAGNQIALPIPSGLGNLVVYCNNATALTVQGIAPGAAGQQLTIVSKGAGQVNLSPSNVAASAQNRLINFVTFGDTPLAAGRGVAVFEYDTVSARWRMVAHDQGAWITPTFAAGDWTATGGAWTVAAGDVSANAYYVRGSNLTFNVVVATSTVVTTPSVLLHTLYGFKAASTVQSPMLANDNAGGWVNGFCNTVATDLSVGFVLASGANWSASVDQTAVSVQVEVPLT